jgi:hypothetical protein
MGNTFARRRVSVTRERRTPAGNGGTDETNGTDAHATEHGTVVVRAATPY